MSAELDKTRILTIKIDFIELHSFHQADEFDESNQFHLIIGEIKIQDRLSQTETETEIEFGNYSPYFSIGSWIGKVSNLNGTE